MESEASEKGTFPARPARPPALKRLKRRLRYHLVRAVLAAFGSLPLPVARRLGTWLGGLAYRVAPRERRRALEGLARAFPEKDAQEREALARESFRHLGRMAFELACVRQLDADLAHHVEWPEADRARFARAWERGRGVLFVTGHLGSWELLARRITSDGFPSATIAREASDPRMTALLGRFREQGGLQTIWRGDPGAARAMLRTLREGRALGLLIDQDTRVQSVFVPFFGHLAATPRAPADLALRTGAALLVGTCFRQPDGRYRLEIEELEVPPPSRGDREAQALALTAALTDRLEAAIRRHPTQWVWMHERWKTRPSEPS